MSLLTSVQGTAQFFDLVEAFCKMLDSLPHDQASTQLVIAQMRNYYNKCYSSYKALVAKPQLHVNEERRPKKSAALAEYNADMRDLATKLLSSSNEEEDVAPLLDQVGILCTLSHDITLTHHAKETTALISTTKTQPLLDTDLILDRKTLCALSTLYTSVRWLSTRILALRHISTNSNSANATSSRPPNRRWTTSPRSPLQPIYLPLDSESVRDFDILMTSFSDLSALILRTLHLELRLQILAGVSKAMSTNYMLNQPYNDPDPAIIALGSSLLVLDGDLNSHLPLTQYSAITSFLSTLADRALVALADKVQGMDTYGCARMQLNILVLQQNLKDLDRDASLGQAGRFWELFEMGPESVVQACRDGEVRREDARVLVRLWGSARGDTGPREVEEHLGGLDALG